MKSSSFTIGLALALSLSAISVASAQTAQRPERARAAQSDSGFRRGPGGQRGGAEAMLLRGITLSQNQKTRIEELRANARKQFGQQGDRARSGAESGQARDAAAMTARRAEMAKRREQRVASIRSILDSQQRTQFDRNVAEMKAHPRQGRGGADRAAKGAQG